MILAAIYLPDTEWLWLAAGLVLVGLILLWRSYRDAALSPGLKWTCTLLKLAGLLGLALCLANPLWVGERARPGANLFLVLADNSQSLQVRDADQPLTRGEMLRSWLEGDETTWQAELEAQFQVRRYSFDQRLQPLRSFAQLDFQGEGSALGHSLRTLAERFQNRPVAGILLFTDANETDLTEETIDLTGLPPLYPVMVGDDSPIRDVAVLNLSVSQTAFEDTPVTIQADVQAQGFAGHVLVAELWKGPEVHTLSTTVLPTPNPPSPLETQRLKVAKDQERLGFRFQFRPDSAGLGFYRVRVLAEAERGAFEDPSLSREATLLNNERWAVVDRGEGPYRVLYVSGRPNWEFKFLNRAMVEDDQIKLIGLIRIARREPKFEFKGRQGESSNPLFRGFDRKTEETERYDQPVLVRFNTEDEAELQGGFPKTAEELFRYEAVILDDLEADFFTRDQMMLLQRFVSERGGGLLTLGGPDSFQAGGYERTPIGDMLPIYLDTPLPDRPYAQLTFNYTREGWLQPWVRLRSNESDERSRLQAMPPFQVLNPSRTVKPGALVLATVTDSQGQSYPALVGQRFGLGRSMALLVADYWRWGFRDESMQADLGKAWRQLLRTLVVDVPPKVQLQARPDPEFAQQMRLEIQARDEAFEPIENAQVQLSVTHLDPTIEAAGPIPVVTEESTVQPGLYQAGFVTRQTGAYFATASVANQAGTPAGSAKTGWTSDAAADEFARLQPNRVLAETLARQTGGQMLTPADLSSWAKELPTRPAPVTEAWSFPLWHQALVFLAALACFIVEWGLRRWRGLA